MAASITITTDDGLEREFARSFSKYFTTIPADEDEAVMPFSSDVWPLVEAYIAALEAKPEAKFAAEDIPFVSEDKPCPFDNAYIPNDLSDEALGELTVAASSLGFDELAHSCAARFAYRFKQVNQEQLIELVMGLDLSDVDRATA